MNLGKRNKSKLRYLIHEAFQCFSGWQLLSFHQEHGNDTPTCTRKMKGFLWSLGRNISLLKLGILGFQHLKFQIVSNFSIMTNDPWLLTATIHSLQKLETFLSLIPGRVWFSKKKNLASNGILPLCFPAAMRLFTSCFGSLHFCPSRSTYEWNHWVDRVVRRIHPMKFWVATFWNHSNINWKEVELYLAWAS